MNFLPDYNLSDCHTSYSNKDSNWAFSFQNHSSLFHMFTLQSGLSAWKASRIIFLPYFGKHKCWIALTGHYTRLKKQVFQSEARLVF